MQLRLKCNIFIFSLYTNFILFFNFVRCSAAFLLEYIFFPSKSINVNRSGKVHFNFKYSFPAKHNLLVSLSTCWGYTSSLLMRVHGELYFTLRYITSLHYSAVNSSKHIIAYNEILIFFGFLKQALIRKWSSRWRRC